MCSSSPNVPQQTEAEKPAILLTARDGLGDNQAGVTAGRKKFRIDLNNASQSKSAYGSSLVIPT